VGCWGGDAGGWDIRVCKCVGGKGGSKVCRGQGTHRRILCELVPAMYTVVNWRMLVLVHKLKGRPYTVVAQLRCSMSL
jgi:hypothetical protein